MHAATFAQHDFVFLPRVSGVPLFGAEAVMAVVEKNKDMPMNNEDMPR